MPDAPRRPDAVAPSGLLPFFVRSSEIGNTDFVDPAAWNRRDLGGHFRLEPEALFLDPTYTAKAMAGLIAQIRSKVFQETETVLFWHTGGQVALFA